uniref:BspA family leucine-rich repeat surface protein n=1 Tax=Ellagibacter isourolithinifaciens TaxID=2137581 RepID=UPI003A92CD95
MKASAKSGRAALNVGAAPQSDGLGDPIADWMTCGTARWMIDASGCLRIEPADGAEGDLPLSGMLGAAPWCGDNDHIRSAVVKEGVRVVAEDGYTSASTGGMFYGCSSLTSLDLSGLDASNVEDMSHMFYGCSSLTSLDLSGLDASKVEDMSHMFDGCSRLESLDLSGLDASSATSMSYMFKGCSRL